MEPAHPGVDRRKRLETLFLSVLPQIEQTSRFVAHRHRLSTAEADDFASEVKVAFIEREYEVLARFEGRSSLRTYLTTVIQRMFVDQLRKRHGRWRPSAEAHRLGVLAVRLETLMYRDGLSLREACETLRTNHGVTESEGALRDLAAKLPMRTPHETAMPDTIEGLRQPSVEPADPGAQFQRHETAVRCQRALEVALAELPPDERVLIRLRFEDGLSVADIARGMSFDQKALYRRLETALASVRRVLIRQGLGWGDVQAMIDEGHCHVRLPSAPRREAAAAGPSQVEVQS